MKPHVRTLWIIAILTVLSVIITLPPSYRLSFRIGSFSFDRVISVPAFDLQIGSLRFQKRFDPRLGLDLAGGTHLVLEADMKDIPSSDRENAFAAARNVVERRINLYGLTEPTIQQAKVGDAYRLIVEIPGATKTDEAIELIGTTAQLTFREEASGTAKVATPSSLLEIWPVKSQLSGKHLSRTEIIFDPNTGKPQVSLEFTPEGSVLFEDITKRSVGKTVAIFLDEELLSAPQVNEAITGGRAVIQGEFSREEAKRLSISLNAGALPVPLTIVEQKHIGATLGQQSIEKSILAGVIGFVIIAAFMIVQYGVHGVVAIMALLFYVLTTLALFRAIPITLTLAGIAGFILSIGMAVDANILIFERMKEEMRWGKDRLTAIALGFDRAFPSIRDSNISSLLTCAILYSFGTGIVRGFAITLAIGIVVSLFSAITVTKTFLQMIYKERS